MLNAVTLRPFYEHLGDIGATGPYPNSLDPWFFLAFAALLIVFRKKVSLSFWSYALGVLLLPYLTRSGGVFGFQSFMRYLLLAFPVFIIMGRLFEERLWLGLSVTAICAGFLFMYSAMFAQWYWIG
ncbi:MAG: hypothetical protein AUI36_11995 [Cyanobacteria bacterium 13_1_40CM_2_61_4]|nr:MAG: hypothetical protein AUI36_11995 [Cyanobacteria bacterium 13_1_40CM_2_61_4]